MKSLIKILLLTILMLFSGCQLNQSVPEGQDINLPPVRGINYLRDVSEIGFEWQPATENSRVKGYIVYRFNKLKRKYEIVKVIKNRYASHFVDTDLKSNIVYRYQFATFSKFGISEPTKDIIVKTLKIEKMPFVRTVLRLPKMVKIIWRPHPNPRVYKYIIQRKEIGTNKWVTIATIRGRLNAEYIDTDLETNKRYKYRVGAVTFTNAMSDYSNSVVGKTKNIPHSVEGLNATLGLPNSIILTWKINPEDDIKYYKIYRRGFDIGQADFDLIGKTTKETFTDDNLKEGEKNEYVVTAVNKFGMESKMQKKPIFGSTLPKIKTPKLEAEAGFDKITLRWDISDLRIKRYNLIKKYEENYQLKGQIFENLTNGIFIDRDVKKGIRYSYQLVAIDKNGVEIEPSEEVNIKLPVGVKF